MIESSVRWTTTKSCFGVHTHNFRDKHKSTLKLYTSSRGKNWTTFLQPIEIWIEFMNTCDVWRWKLLHEQRKKRRTVSPWKPAWNFITHILDFFFIFLFFHTYMKHSRVFGWILCIFRQTQRWKYRWRTLMFNERFPADRERTFRSKQFHRYIYMKVFAFIIL